MHRNFWQKHAQHKNAAPILWYHWWTEPVNMNELQIAQCSAFEALTREEQMSVLQKDGVYVGKLKDGEGTRLLYQYQAIYVEVKYEVHRKHIREVSCFSDTAILDQYILSEGFDKTP